MRSGSCFECSSYNSYWGKCAKYKTLSNISYVDFECNKAARDKLNIIVLYNSSIVDRNKCPESVKYKGKHINMKLYSGGWNYQEIKNALNNEE